nr:retrovirus-related Pol polyprotein from transposon TNT 1-94 [Tanacetum cinerariifolium]
MSSECNNIKLAIHNDKYEVVCAMCKQCLITANHDVSMQTYVNNMNSYRKKQNDNVSNVVNQKKHKLYVRKSKKLGSKERLASPMSSKPIYYLRWSPAGKMFDIKENLIASSESNGDNACFGDLQWGNILITRVYFIEGLGHNLFSVGQFCDSDLEVAFRRNTCLFKNLEGVDLLKVNHTKNFYTINLHDMASASPIFLMARATSTMSWLWHQRLSHLNFDTINDLAKNDLIISLPKLKNHKEHLCLSCEQGKSKRASHPPIPIPNSKQRLHLLHMDLCGPMRIASINRKRKPDISFLYVFGALCYPKNDREDIGKLGAKVQTSGSGISILLTVAFIFRQWEVPSGSGNFLTNRQFCDSDLEVAFRRNACFVRNLEGVDLLKGDRSTNLYTINLHEMASASPICLMACASSTKSWLWHQRLSHLNFDTINDLAKNDLVSGLPKLKYHKEHLCPSCEQEKSKRASHPPKPIPNSRQRLHLLHMDLCGPMRIASINGKRCVLVIVDDYARYTWVHFLRSKDEAPETLVEVARTMLILSRAPLFLWAEAIATECFTQNHSIIHRPFNKIPYELINGRKSDISFLHVFEALCYPKNDHEDIGKLGAKGDIGFFIGYSTDSCAYRVFNRRTKKIMETMNVSFDELSTMAFEQRSSKPGLQSMTSGQISSGLDLTYAPSTITTQQPTKGELDLLFEAMYDDFIGGQPSSAQRTILAAQAQQVRQMSMTSTSIADSATTPTISSSQATNFPITSHDVDEINSQQQHAQQQGNQAHL